MSTSDLARRLGVSQVAVVKLEASERAGRVGLDTLTRAAAALDCDLVYALVPRTSLEAHVRSQAERVVTAHLQGVVNSMQLEGQRVSDEAQRDTYADLVDTVIEQPGLWSRA
jgi:predicted DNA-binding mobile mystery protein A